MAVRKRGNAWEVDVQVAGQRIRQSLGPGSTKAEARELEAKIRREHRAGVIGRPAGYTLDEAVKRWLEEHVAHLKSSKETWNHVQAIRDYLHGRKLADIHKVAEEYKQDALAAGYNPATINRRLAVFRQVANIAYKRWEWVAEPVGDKIQMVSGENERHVYLTPAQVEEIAFHCRQRAATDMIRLAAYTGLRQGELLSLTPDNIQDDLLVLDANTKSGKPRVVPILPRVEGAVGRLPYPYAARTLSKWFERARDAAGYPHVRFHDLRHTYASWLAKNGADLTAMRDLLGHSSFAMTNRYAHLQADRLREAAAGITSQKGRNKKWKSRRGGR